MATQSATIHSSHARHGSSGSATMPYPPLPGSPTLTNPDMILPDYERADSPEDRSHSPLSMWKTAQPSDLNFHLPRPSTFNSAPAAITTPIIYGNGTMLSDIGEVTEAESTVGHNARRTSSRYSVQSDEEAGLQPATILVQGVVKKRSQIKMHERRSSTDSTSTITTQDQKGHFADFDEAASVDDSVFQGDDEESMASSYVDDNYGHGQHVVTKQVIQNTDRFSTNSIGQRAEHILANAKRRLTTMEGNLSRARTSLNYASMSDGSTPSPPMIRPATSLHESTVPLSPAHSRNGSDNSLSGSLKQHLQSRRSASALGAAGGYRQPGTKKSGERLNGGSKRNPHLLSQHPLDTTLQPLSEDEDDNESASDSRRSSALESGMTSPEFTSYSDAGLSRSASVAQMRDIQDHMSGLKSKISSLKEQARADSLKRRSLQSLRTPSPFTHSRWDQGFVESRSVKSLDLDQDDQTAHQAEGVPGRDTSGQKTPTNEHEIGPLNEHPDQPGTAEGEVSPNGSPKTFGGTPSVGVGEEMEAIGDDLDDLHTENGGFDDNIQQEQEDDMGDIDYASESGESTYHDTFQNPVSHEDREDAFDYERFFLHSAMGTISQQRLGHRGSFGSVSSEESVETTRGPDSGNPRRASLDTMSSVESFETATEGVNSRSSTSHGRSSYETAREVSPRERTGSGYGFTHLDGRPRQNSVLHRPAGSNAVSTLHRPSISSFDSTGTNRSFPLVNKARLSGGVLTPGGSPDHQLKQISEVLMHDTASILSKEGVNGEAFIQMLDKEDRTLVEGLVAGLGRCVFGLGEAPPMSAEGREYRQRLEAARRILGGFEELSE